MGLMSCGRDDVKGGCLFMEYPLVSSRKHIRSGLPVEEYHIRVPYQAKDEIEDTSAPALTPEQSKSKGFWDRTLTACSCFNIPDEPQTIKIRRCCDCGRKIGKGEKFARETVVLSTTKNTIQSDTERQAYCYECSQINQGRLEHAICIKGVRRDLRTHFKLKRKKKREEAEKQKIAEKEAEKKNKFKTWLKAQKAKKAKKQEEMKKLNETQDTSLNETQDSSLNETRDSSLNDTQDSPLNETQDSPLNLMDESSITKKKDSPMDETQDTIEEKQEELQMVYSTPKSLHYRFEEAGAENENKKPYVPVTKKNKGFSGLVRRAKRTFSTKEKHEGTKVKTVAISW